MPRYVAPYVGAWIETKRNTYKAFYLESHPTWVRGLKPEFSDKRICENLVAPYVGAWIETNYYPKKVPQIAKSHPTWVRGLKRFSLLTIKSCLKSHPTWVRGLKRIKVMTWHNVRCRTIRGCVD